MKAYSYFQYFRFAALGAFGPDLLNLLAAIIRTSYELASCFSAVWCGVALRTEVNTSAGTL
jgi:hypothetical protein